MEDICWKNIEGFEGLYQVSVLGQVKHLAYWRFNKLTNTYSNIKEKIIKPQLSNRGRLEVGLHKDKRQYMFKVHRLVAFAFPEICGEYFEGAEVNHLDEDPTNNAATNLRWVTKQENINWGTRNERIVNTRKTNHDYNEKPVLQYDMEGNFIKEYRSIEEAKRITGAQHISYVCKGKAQTSGGYKWEYKSI